MLLFLRGQPYISFSTVAATHVDCAYHVIATASTTFNGDLSAITNLGPDICFRLAKPILERCDAEQLLQIENASPVCYVIILNSKK